MDTSRPLTLSLPSELLERIDHICAGEDRSRAELIGEAVQWYLERLPLEDPREKELEAIEQGRQAIARGEYVGLDDFLDMARRVVEVTAIVGGTSTTYRR